MRHSIDERIMLAQPLASEFFSDAIAAYDREGAREICEVLIGSLEDGQSHVPMREPPRGLKVTIGEPEDLGADTVLIAFAEVRGGIIKFMLNREAKVEEIVSWLPDVATHELAHLAHYQNNPLMFRRPGSLWQYTLREGLAEYSAESRKDEFDPGLTYNIDPELWSKIEGVLLEVLFYPGKNQSERHYEYIFGDDSFPDRAYVVGKAVVSLMVAKHGLDQEQLMKLSLHDWRRFAETEL